MSELSVITGLFSLTVMINLFFGFMRGRTEKYSLKWFLCIHMPIPVIFIARTNAHISMRFIPLFLLAALIGQILGGKVEY